MREIFEKPYLYKFKSYDAPKALYPGFPEAPHLSFTHIDPLSAASIRLCRRYLKAIFGWFPANPNKSIVINQLNDVYVDMNYESFLSFSHYKTANLIIDENSSNASLFKDNNILSDLYDKKEAIYNFDEIFFLNSDVVLLGVRGVGKTSFVNYWLNKRTKFLESNRITWFRVDITKVIKTFDENILNDDEFFSMMYNYSKIHLVYVLLNYSGKFSEIGSENISHLFKYIVDEMANSGDFITSCSAIKDNYMAFIHKLDDVERSDISEIYIRSLLTSGKRNYILIEHFKKIYDLFKNIISKRGIDVTILIDGIDNLSWNRESKSYRIVCRSAGRFFRTVYHDFGGHLRRVISIRPEALELTQLHINQGEIGNQNASSGDDLFFEPCVVRPPNALSIISRKFDAALESDAFKITYNTLLKEGESLGASANALRGEIKEVQALCIHIVNSLEDYIEKRLKDNEPGIWNAYQRKLEDNSAHDGSSIVLDALFDQDVRGFLASILETAITIRILEARKLRNVRQSNRIIQYMFLAGRPYFNSLSQMALGSRSDYRSFFDVFPNIFWFNEMDIRRERSLWHGCVGPLILKIFSIYGTATIEEAKLIICEDLGYSSVVFDECASAFVAFGLIDATTRTRQINGIHRAVFKITNKGAFFKKCFFDSPEMMYFYSYDTPFAAEYVTRSNFTLYRSFDFSETEVSFYDASYIPVSIFIRHYYQQTKKDLESLKLSKNLENLFNNIDSEEVSSAINDLEYIEKRYNKYIENIRNSRDVDYSAIAGRIGAAL